MGLRAYYLEISFDDSSGDRTILIGFGIHRTNKLFDLFGGLENIYEMLFHLISHGLSPWFFQWNS